MQIEAELLKPDHDMPNSDLPLIVISEAVPSGEATSQAMTARFERNGWQGTWTYTVFDYWHYHIEGHEVLGCVSGTATVGLGGEGGIRIAMQPGDVVIIPAGVGHKRLDADAGFQVVGAYPPGQNGAITRAGEMDLEAARRAIAALSLPETDPVTGERPGAVAKWLD
ncbi:cupin domain-containing protein [Aurantimonas sp. VKM B-3413]|uniref:cupin domain-containing protein n=1 Tax=Aurantimonas sp. VKM B-3413 TaxID=2779401 RepID=UPI001E430BC8|nr:cupin domain-containing protein [Aurantimonas sp. VKM B-3413]MCB8835997.1 cupin domain-containing protein [Aurantimonas sp. VKM B-3413]